MPAYCSVVGCKNGYRGQASRAYNVAKLSSDVPQKIGFFRTPKDEGLFMLWSQNIPMKEGSKLSASSRICEEHFVDHDIIKHDETIIGGKTILNPRTNWKLRNGVVPCIFEDSTLQHLLPTKQVIPEQTKRKAPIERKPLGNISIYKQHCRKVGKPRKAKAAIDKAKKLGHKLLQEAVTVTLNEEITTLAAGQQNHKNPIETNKEREETMQLDCETISQEPIPITFNKEITVVTACEQIHMHAIETSSLETNKKREESVQFDCNKIQLPSPSWKKEQVLNTECVHYFEMLVKENGIVIPKTATVDFKNRKMKATINSRELSVLDEQERSFTSILEVEAFLRKLHAGKICPGIIHNPEKHRKQETSLVRNGEIIEGVWRAKNCTLITQSAGEIIKPCKSCILIDKLLKMQFKNHKAIQLNSTTNHRYLSIEQLSKKVAAQGKDLVLTKIRLAKQQAENKELKKEINVLRVNLASIKNDRMDDTSLSVPQL